MRWHGCGLDELKATDFFQWFCLELDETQTNAQVRQHYRPSGPAFGALVMLVVDIDLLDRVSSLQLNIKRSFIANHRNSPFARDIAASFIALVVPPPEIDELRGVFDEIRNRELKTVVFTRSDLPRLEPDPSDAFSAFIGRAPQWRCSMPSTILTLTNQDLTEKGDLVIRAEKA